MQNQFQLIESSPRNVLLANESIAIDPQIAVEDLGALLQRYQLALETIPEGICYFGRDDKLVFCNRRYSEIYQLQPQDVLPGTSLAEIVALRAAVGTCSREAEGYLSFLGKINSSSDTTSWTADLRDGRTIHINRHPLPDGGWVAIHQDFTERKAKAKNIPASDIVSTQALIDWVPDYLWIKDREGRFVVINKALAQDSCFADTSDMIGLSDFDFQAPEAARGFRAQELEIFQTGKPMIDREEYVVNGSGTGKWLLSTKVPMRNEQNEVIGLVGIARDITERKKADALRDGQSHILEMIAMSVPLETVLDYLMRLVESQLPGIRGSVLLLEPDGLHLRHGAAPSLPEDYCNAIDGVHIGPKVGSCGTAAYLRETVIVSDIEHDPLWEAFADQAKAHGLRSCWSTPIFSHNGSVLGTFAAYSGTVREPVIADTKLIDTITNIAAIAIDRRKAEDRIFFLANHDALTGLPNRILLQDRLSQAMLRAQRDNNWVTLVFLDLDNFKLINDTLGHSAGDVLLKTVAERMSAHVRSTDTVVRIGGDEFVILLLDQPKNVGIIAVTLQKIRDAISETMLIEGHAIKVTSSIGVANYPNDGTDAETLLANADAAMYCAKETGRDNYQFFVPELNQKVREKYILVNDLRNAVARSEFVLDYQPQVDLRSGQIFAAEALVRWMHPTRGLVSPLDFIPIAEETGLIVQIGDWVLHEACRQNKAWQDAGLPHIGVSVNVSARQFRQKNLIDNVTHALSESGLEAKYLDLEITESLVMQDVESAVATMRTLENLGVQISIDDFGTGYSNFSTLKTFPIARLKIDKSFVNNLQGDDSDRAITSAMIALGQILKLRVIAEGVETAEQIDFLRDHNCDEMQGYHFSKPVGFEAIAEMLAAEGTVRQKL